MNKKNQLIGRVLAIILTAVCSNSLADGSGPALGPAGTSGGDIRGSTLTEVESAINKAELGIGLFNKFPLYYLEYALKETSAFPIKDKKAKEMLIKMLPGLGGNPKKGETGKYIFLDQDLATKTCTYNGKEVDSSIRKSDKKLYEKDVYYICLSKQRLTRFPKESLMQEILALLVHEVSHAYGYNEDAGKFIQKYVYEKFLNFSCTVSIKQYLDQFGTTQFNVTDGPPVHYLREIAITFTNDGTGMSKAVSHLRDYYSTKPLKDDENPHQELVVKSPTTSIMDRTISQVDHVLKGNWDPSAPTGFIELPVINSDGSYTSQKIEFKNKNSDSGRNYIYSADVTNTQNIDGKEIKFQSISISESCNR